MATIKKRDLTEEEAHGVSLDLQNAERQLRKNREQDDVHATLFIWFGGEPEEITVALGLQPDDVIRKGETLFDEGRWQVKSDETSWTLSSGNRIDSSITEDHIQWILDQVEGKLPALNRLRGAGARTKLHVYASQLSQLFSLDLSTEMLLQLARYNLQLSLVVNHLR